MATELVRRDFGLPREDGRILVSVIDCHAHLAAPEFDPDRDAVVARARAAGVRAILVVGEDGATNDRVLTVCGQYPELRPCLGLHPDRWTDGKPLPDPGELDRVIEQIRVNRPLVKAIGEVGLDHRTATDQGLRRAQAAALARFARLALELDLPLNVHSRSAGHHAVELLLEAGASRVLMHAFDGRAVHAEKGAAAGFLFSIPPSIVRSRQKEKLVERLPLGSLVLESDSPVLGPEAMVRNEPANIAHALRAIARIQGVSEEEVRAATTRTARALFRL